MNGRTRNHISDVTEILLSVVIMIFTVLLVFDINQYAAGFPIVFFSSAVICMLQAVGKVTEEKHISATAGIIVLSIAAILFIGMAVASCLVIWG